MAEEKKVFIRGHQWGTIFANVQNRGKTLRDEALRFGIDEATLIKMGDEKFSHSSEWDNCKRVSAKREKKQTLKNGTSSLPEAPTQKMPVLVPTPASAPTDSMEELLCKRDKLQKEVEDCASFLEEAKAILDIRQGTLADAKDVLEKAQQAVQQAEAEEEDAKQAVQQAEAQQVEAQEKLEQVEGNPELKEKTIYLVDPWYTGEFPEYGTFFSTVEMEGVQVLKPVETIEPDFKDMVSSGFDLVSEYTRALSFVSLVQDYILKGEAHSVLNTDTRVKNLLDKHIG